MAGTSSTSPQLEPGVQIQDGGNFDPTKKGYESVSFGGRFGRTARIEVDGLDISDETVGTTTQNVPMNSIQEFQASQSSLDISTELTSSGTLNVLTKSGSNQIHGGGGLYGYRDNGISAVPSTFTQKGYGANLGGPIIKDKLFAFGAWERTVLSLNGLVAPTTPFNDLSAQAAFPVPRPGIPGKTRLQPYVERPRILQVWLRAEPGRCLLRAKHVRAFRERRQHTELTAAEWTSRRAHLLTASESGTSSFGTGLPPAPLPAGPLNPAPDISLAIGNVSTSCTASGDLWCSGLNILAPQGTFQTDKQFKYDGTKVLGTHTLRYGVGVNRILGGGFANFFGLGPAVRAASNPAEFTFAAGDPFGPGGTANPLNWPVHRVDVGNGEGCFTEIAGFGQNCGGQFDTRFQAYVADTWKFRPGLTFNFGLRYNRDTGRTDSDLPAIPALNAFEPGLGNPVRQPNKNFGGVLGVAWDPWKTGKTVFRAGAGVYFENGVFNNVLFDRPGRLTKGLFNSVQEVCTQGGQLFMPDGSVPDVDRRTGPRYTDLRRPKCHWKRRGGNRRSPDTPIKQRPSRRGRRPMAPISERATRPPTPGRCSGRISGHRGRFK